MRFKKANKAQLRANREALEAKRDDCETLAESTRGAIKSLMRLKGSLLAPSSPEGLMQLDVGAMLEDLESVEAHLKWVKMSQEIRQSVAEYELNLAGGKT